MTRLFDRPIDTVRGLVRFLAMRLSLISGTKLLEINKHATWIDALYKNATWIEALSVFRLFSTPHFYICHFFCYGIAVFATSQYSPHAESEVELRAKMV